MPTKKELERKLAITNDALEMALTVSPERDNNFFTGGLSGLYTDPLNRSAWDRKKVFAESLRAWRVNPIARRIVKLMTSFVIGKGIEITSEDEATNAFIQEWAKKNKLRRNLKRWKDEDTRTGNLFALFNVQADGMSIIRLVPAELIDEIETDPNDIETERRYRNDATIEGEQWEAYDPDREQPRFMLHFATNQPVGSSWGEADLSPLLVWIGRFSSWLEDRVRLNKFRTVFMYVVRGQFKDEAERLARERAINANPPKPGSVLVTTPSEDWGILNANLDAFDASVDGVAIKKMIATGVGFPMHWLAEPEDSNRSTAEAAGTPSFRTLEEAQKDFFEFLEELTRTALEVKSRHGGGVNPSAELKISGSDITERDNASLALALGRAYPHLAEMLDREAIDDKEFMRLVYKMFAEVWDESKSTSKIKRKPLTAPNTRPGGPGADAETDPTDPKEDTEE